MLQTASTSWRTALMLICTCQIVRPQWWWWWLHTTSAKFCAGAPCHLHLGAQNTATGKDITLQSVFHGRRNPFRPSMCTGNVQGIFKHYMGHIIGPLSEVLFWGFSGVVIDFSSYVLTDIWECFMQCASLCSAIKTEVKRGFTHGALHKFVPCLVIQIQMNAFSRC